MPNIRKVILETLSQRGPLPIAEIARAARHSVLATRYHLGLLVGEGLVSSDTVARRSTVGRPQALYALADRAHQQLPKQYDWLAASVLAELQHTLGEKETRALLRRTGKRLAGSMPAARRGTRLVSRLERAVEFLSVRGYMAQLEKANAGLVLRICNCPYHEVARAHRQVCEMDVAMISTLLDAPMKMTQCIANQDAQCVFVIKPSVK